MTAPRNGNRAALNLLIAVGLLVGGVAFGRMTFDPAVLIERIGTLQVSHDKLFVTVEKQRDELADMRLQLDVAILVANELVELREMLEGLRP